MINFTKPLFSLFIVLLVSVSCERDDAPLKNGKVSFSFTAQSTAGGGRTSATDEPRFLRMTLKNVSISNPVPEYDAYTHLKVELFTFGNEVVSAPIELLSNNYDLVDFGVLNADDNLLYAIPWEDSKLAQLVTDPLPIHVNIIADQTIKIPLQVVAVSTYTQPEDFGYTAFSFDVVEPLSFQLAVFIYDPVTQNFELTTCTLAVTSAGENLFNKSLPASTNRVVIKKGHTSFDLLVSKPGYTPYSSTLTEAELLRYQTNEVLIVKLN